jgi:hypothetical protein
MTDGERLSTMVTIPGKGQFHNLKVFVRSPEASQRDWQCVYWHVSRVP